MKNLIFASAAVLGLSSAAPALAERAQVPAVQLAANALLQQNESWESTRVAGGGGNHPQANTGERGVQPAASAITFGHRSLG